MIEPGGVQWMTAAKGILHSEMPEQEEGLLKGFQLWVNLPASAKMSEPAYQEFPEKSTPLEHRENGSQIRVIAGQTNLGTVGPVLNNYTQPTYMDISLPANTAFEQTLPSAHNAFLYMIEGDVSLLNAESDIQENKLKVKNLGVLSQGETLSLESGAQGARLLLIAGKPLNEPVARSGPFVMNTQAEVMQAYNDFRRGNF